MEDVPRELENWMRRILPKAVAYARTLVPEPETAEDLVQDVFCRLLDHPEYNLLQEGEKILFRSITNACINEVTRRKQIKSLDERGEYNTRSAYALKSAEPDPAETAVKQDIVGIVQEELACLPEMYRAAVELKAWGKSLNEIADTLDVSRSNAGVLIHRGRNKLRRKLGDLLPEELQ